ncbi:LuxR family transcriptional regulator [Reticulibacter mediterranei]|uniref:LuxR family transcriptional regulator n=1 Tax=Reticulibacter mediterranei TaxID=2778369 RepID=A0A8J3IGV0_9CHLR|nr:LuxR C-terminal-related transcriptional regulator [Reticulibacter mediterranei]GHO90016.1 LuxR family transcriptional regulator [Reticulibacter mediterranei]
MPKSSLSTLIWSQVHQRYELQKQGQPMQCFLPEEEPAFTRWLEEQTSFAFRGQSGRLSLLKEARSAGTSYWYAYRKRASQTCKRYLGATPRLTFARLEQVAKELSGSPSPLSLAQEHPEQQNGQGRTLLATRLIPPRVPGFLVERPRLLHDLDALWTYPLVLVSASAGSGKTTLLSTWGSRQEHPVAWLSLDALDNDPVRFWASCIAALRRCWPALGEEAFALLHAREAPPLSTILVALLNDIMYLDRKLILILDDYHLVSEQSIHEGVLFVLDHLPATLHLVLISRIDPELPLSRLRVHHQLLEIRDQELRFTQQEAASFLTQGMGLALSEEEVAILHQRTVGWIAGLQLAALSLSRQSDPSSAVADFGGSHRYLLDYIQQDILVQLKGPLQDFLLQTSVVTSMNAALCQAITASPTLQENQQMLEEVERANLFVVPLDSRRHWYRYHDLFREALQARLQASLPALVPLLHVRAARWYEMQGERREAITHALAAPDFSYAAALIKQAAQAFWLQGEVRTVHTWVLALPDAVLRTHLRLALDAAFHFLNAASVDTESVHANRTVQIERTCTRMEGIVRRKAELSLSEAEEALIKLRLHVLRALIQSRVLLKRGDIEHLGALVREMEALPADEEENWNLIRLSPVFLCEVMLQGKGASLIPRLREAVQTAKEAADFQVTIRAIAWLAFASGQAGQLHRAHQEALWGLALLEREGGHITWPGYLYYTLFNVSYAWNKLEEAAEWLKLMRQSGQDWHQIELLGIGEVYGARLALMRGDLGAAELSLHQLEVLVAHERFTLRAPWVSILRVQVWLAQGNLEAASAWTAQTMFSSSAWNPVRRWEMLLLVRVLLAQQQSDQAVETLSRFRQYFDRPEVLDATFEWMALSVVALSRSGKREQALLVATHLLTITEPESYIRLELDTSEPLMKEVLTIWLEAHPEEISQAGTATLSRSSVLRMLMALKGEAAPRSTQANGASSALSKSVARHKLLEPLSRQEQQVLRLLVAGQTYAEMAQTLTVSPNTIKTQVSSIYRKLGVSRRAEAIAVTARLPLF